MLDDQSQNKLVDHPVGVRDKKSVESEKHPSRSVSRTGGSCCFLQSSSV